MIKLKREQVEKLMEVAKEVFGEDSYMLIEGEMIYIGKLNSPFHAEAHVDEKDESGWTLLW